MSLFFSLYKYINHTQLMDTNIYQENESVTNIYLLQFLFQNFRRENAYVLSV